MKERRGRRRRRRALFQSSPFGPSSARDHRSSSQRGPSAERRSAPPFAVDRLTCSGVRAGDSPSPSPLLPSLRSESRQKKSTLGFGKRAMAGGGGRGGEDGSEGGGGRICHARREESGRGSPSPGQTPKRTPGGDGPGRGRSVRPSVRGRSVRPNALLGSVVRSPMFCPSARFFS